MIDLNRLLIVLAAAVCIAFDVAAAEAGAEAVVQAQLEAYNARDIDAFLVTYAEDAQLFELPDKLLARGSSQLRERYTKRFANTRLHAEIVKRIVLGDTVVDHERVRMTLPEGPGTLETIAIYEVRDGKITTVWFRYGGTKPDKKLGAS
ncbi:MAG TPA: nuclear transport factor 2 family protein [Chthoniobacterales bacterium]|nr:nuclear transport factor 2 family protein [Chthoniobacterales bacterium]